MKRAGNLYAEIAEKSNLELAFWKAQKGKSSQPYIRAFRDNLDEELDRIREELLSGTHHWGDYHRFYIHEPKKRLICACSFQERVIQHAVMNICEPFFEKYQIFDSYACRKGKGVDACLRRTQYFCRKYPRYIKFDIHKFFDSINHKTMLGLLNRHFKDPNLINLFSNLIESYEVSPECGLPIGNLLSQHFANMYLGTLDHEIKDCWQCGGYVRYMDDFIIFTEFPEQEKQLYSRVQTFLQEVLHLTLNVPVINATAHGIPFLSYSVHSDHLRLSLKAKRRFQIKIRQCVLNEDASRTLPLLSFINRASSHGFRKKILNDIHHYGSPRVCRGGSWNNNARNCRVANRNNNDPGNRNNNVGFRVVLSAAQAMDGFPVIEPVYDSIPVSITGQKSERIFPPVDKSFDSGNTLVKEIIV